MEEKVWFSIFFFLIVFMIVYVATYILNYSKWKKKKYQSIGEYHYLLMKFHLKNNDLPLPSMLLTISLLDALIISFVTTFITSLEIGIMWQMLIGFALLFCLIYAVYELYGRHLVKKYKKRKE